MPFHRLNTPLYFGGLLVGYDYINLDPSAGTPPDPALADGPISWGPNFGTYWMGFGEDATSEAVNRGYKALSENTDFLDDLMHRDLSVLKVSPVYTAGASETSKLITGPPTGPPIFLGVVGKMPVGPSPADLNIIVEVRDPAGNEVIDPITGTKILVVSVVDSGGNQPGVDNFSAGNVSFNFSPAIPNGTQYQLHYGIRADLASLPLDALTDDIIRGTQETTAKSQDLFRLLHGNNAPWTDPWTSTIYDLAGSGLDERYRRATSVAVTPSFDTPGDGAVIIRDGIAPTSKSESTVSFHDPVNALWVSKDQNLVPAGALGSTGFVSYGNQLDFDAADESRYKPTVTSFMSFWRHTATSASGTIDYSTRIPDGYGVTLYAGSAAQGSVYLNLGTGQFHNTVYSGIACGYDMLEVTRASGAVETYIIAALDTDPRQCFLVNLDGSLPSFLPDEAANITWLSTSFYVGHNLNLLREYQTSSPSPAKIDGLLYSMLPLTADSGNPVYKRDPARFVGPGYGVSPADAVVRWGRYDHDLSSFTPTYEFLGELTEDGGVFATRYRTDTEVHGWPTPINASTNPTVDLDFAQGGIKWVRVAGTGTVYLNINNEAQHPGGTLVVVFEKTGTGTVGLVWGGSVTNHHPPGDTVPTPSPTTVIDVWRGVHKGPYTDVFWQVTRDN